MLFILCFYFKKDRETLIADSCIRYQTPSELKCPPFSLRNDFKFIGQSLFKTNIFLKSQFLLSLHQTFSKTNRFTCLEKKSLMAKTWELIYFFYKKEKWFIGISRIECFTPTLEIMLLKI